MPILSVFRLFQEQRLADKVLDPRDTALHGREVTILKNGGGLLTITTNLDPPLRVGPPSRDRFVALLSSGDGVSKVPFLRNNVEGVLRVA